MSTATRTQGLNTGESVDTSRAVCQVCHSLAAQQSITLPPAQTPPEKHRGVTRTCLLRDGCCLPLIPSPPPEKKDDYVTRLDKVNGDYVKRGV
ncbi:hypothetical protein BaRGS_00027170 [Batillaria attramentaria]|uniref:Uncharacterized protein n=1 Tax=Batillaria attramentaria TaxID=370345 RepID=A0ABD0K323_9CAEN